MHFTPMYAPNMPLSTMAAYATRQAHLAQMDRLKSAGLHREAKRLQKAHNSKEASEVLFHIIADLLS